MLIAAAPFGNAHAGQPSIRGGSVLRIQYLQDDRGGDAGHDDQKDDSRKILRGQQPHRQPLLGHDQGHLAPGHHAHADFQAVLKAEAADFCHQAAADDLGDQSHHHEPYGKQQNPYAHMVDAGLQADAGEEHRAEDDVRADFHFPVDIGRVPDGAQNDAGHIGSRDVGNPEIALSRIGEEKAQRKPQDGNPLGMGITVVQLLEYFEYNDAHHQCHDEEQHRGDDHAARIGFRVLEADDKSQHNDADDIIDDGGAEDRGANLPLQLPHLLQGLHRNADAGSRHDDAGEHCFIESIRSPGGHAVKAHIEQGAAQQRDEHAGTGDQKRHGPCLHQILQVRLQPRGEHQQHHADFRHHVQEIRLLHQAQHAWAYQKPGDDFAHYLRRFAFPGQYPEKLRCYDDDCQILKNCICFHDSTTLFFI